MNLIRLRADLVLLVAGAYVILNLGVMVLLLPPGGGIPVGEWILLLFVLTFVLELRRIPSFVRVAPVAPLAIWWLVGGVGIVTGVAKHGIWALRDATHMIESLFLWVGFVVAASPGFFARFSKWLRWLLNIGAVYSLLFPFRETLAAYSPKVAAPAGYSAPVLFNYVSGGLVPLTAATAWLLERVRFLGIPATMLAGFVIVYTVAFYQMRTTYLQIIVLFAVLLLVQPRAAVRLSGALLAGAVALAAVLASGIQITGRLGEAFTLDFFVQHFAAMWGAEGSGAVRGAAEGVPQRLGWWLEIWHKLTSSPGTLLFGLGYGIPLIDFNVGEDIVVREPHNSMISIVARVGVIGLFAFLWFQVSLALIWMKVYARLTAHKLATWRNNALIMAVYFLLVWVLSIGEDAFEKPFNTIPYYLMWGIILRVQYEFVAGGDLSRFAGTSAKAQRRAPIAAR